VDHTGLQDPELAVERQVCELLGEAQVASPPVPLDLLASFRGVVAVEVVDMPHSGVLLAPDQQVFRIRIRAADPPGRQRFSVAHEITHLLIPGYHEHPMDKVDGLTGEFPSGDEEEYLCDIGASNMLLPEAMVRAECSRLRPSMESLFAMAELFQSSLESTALRIDQLLVWPCVPVVWEWGMKPSQRTPEGQASLFGLAEAVPPEEEFRVKFHAGHRASMFFPRHRHAPRESAMVAACTSGEEFRGRSTLLIGDHATECYVEARPVPYRDSQGDLRRRIVSLVFA
jgi:hypothetical protein